MADIAINSLEVPDERTEGQTFTVAVNFDLVKGTFESLPTDCTKDFINGLKFDINMRVEDVDGNLMANDVTTRCIKKDPLTTNDNVAFDVTVNEATDVLTIFEIEPNDTNIEDNNPTLWNDLSERTDPRRTRIVAAEETEQGDETSGGDGGDSTDGSDSGGDSGSDGGGFNITEFAVKNPIKAGFVLVGGSVALREALGGDE